jgi:hypothetical protein
MWYGVGMIIVQTLLIISITILIISLVMIAASSGLDRNFNWRGLLPQM